MLPNSIYQPRPMAGNEAQGFGNQPSGQFRQNALAGLGQPQQMGGAPGQQQRGAWLTQQGYTGPLPGSPELMAARQAGEHPIAQWIQQNHPGAGQGWPGNGGGLNPGQPQLPWQGQGPIRYPPNPGPMPPYMNAQNPWAWGR
jgi:hypothetical protein